MTLMMIKVDLAASVHFRVFTFVDRFLPWRHAAPLSLALCPGHAELPCYRLAHGICTESSLDQYIRMALPTHPRQSVASKLLPGHIKARAKSRHIDSALVVMHKPRIERLSHGGNGESHPAKLIHLFKPD